MIEEPKRQFMDFNKARTFIEVADSGSVTSAATRLLRSQQAISQQLLLLEDELEIKLFDRVGPKIILTQAGEHLYRDFKPLFLDIETSVQELKADKSRVSGLIRIGAWMEQSVSYLPEMIRIFSTSFPMVDFHLEVGMDDELEERLQNNELDMAFLVFTQNKKLFHREAVYRQPIIPVVSRRFLTHHNLPETIEQTLEFPLMDYIDEYSSYNIWIKKNARELLPLARKKVPNITMTNNIALKQLVIQGLGIGFLHQEMIPAELDIGELVPILKNQSHQPVSVEIDMVYKRKHSLGYVHLAFAEFIRKDRDSWMV